MSELLSFILSAEDAFKSKARLASLYSDFARLKTTNSDGYYANTSAWLSALTRASRAGVLPSPNNLSIAAGDELARELEVKGLGRPVALDAVFNEAINSGDLFLLQDFLNSTSGIYKKPSWLPHLYIPSASEIAHWSLRQIGLTSSTKHATGAFVIKANVEAASQATLKRLTPTLLPGTPSTQVHSLETFTATFSNVVSPSSSARPLTAEDISILLKHLSRDLSACSILPPTSSNATTTIKFRAPNAAAGTPAPLITETDTTLAHLSTLQLSLRSSIDTLETNLETLSAQLEPLISASSTSASAKAQALALLKRRKALTTTLERRQSSLQQIEETIRSIDDAASNAEIVQALAESAKVLRGLNEKVGGVEGVEGVMEGLAKERGKVEEVSAVLTEGSVVDEGEVEEELEAMLGEVEGKKEVEKAASAGQVENVGEGPVEQHSKLELPDAPTTEPEAKERVGNAAMVTTEKEAPELVKRLSLQEEPMKEQRESIRRA